MDGLHSSQLCGLMKSTYQKKEGPKQGKETDLKILKPAQPNIDSNSWCFRQCSDQEAFYYSIWFCIFTRNEIVINHDAAYVVTFVRGEDISHKPPFRHISCNFPASVHFSKQRKRIMRWHLERACLRKNKQRRNPRRKDWTLELERRKNAWKSSVWKWHFAKTRAVTSTYVWGHATQPQK